MSKRMVDTELWNNEDIIEHFTAEDRYFWLYLLTNPHNSICGVMRSSPALIARDMGYSKECVQNLIYRFENIHKAIFVDKETSELVILNWGKFNWTKSPKLVATIKKERNKIRSEAIRSIIDEKVINIGICENVENPIPYRYRTNTNTHSIHNTTTTTNNNTYLLTYIEPDGDIAKKIEKLFSPICDLHPAFIAYNNARGWKGYNGENVLDNLEFYVEQWKRKEFGVYYEYL